jgi:YD repeat-containing protein
VRYADGTYDQVFYDVHGNAISTTDANGSTVTNAYDALNRLTGRTIAPGPHVSADTTGLRRPVRRMQVMTG